MIREGRPSDAKECHRLALEALKRDQYAELEIDNNKVWKIVLVMLNSKQHFVWVSEEGGKIHGVLAAMVAPHAFYKHSQAIVLMWYCTVTGEGGRLMAKFMEWVKERPNITQVERSAEKGEDQNIHLFLSRIGFNHSHENQFLLRAPA